MGKLILITGGARSGKSTYAEQLAQEQGENVLYIATALAIDDEMKDRIAKHRKQRPSYWQTVETYEKFSAHIDFNTNYDCILLDCVTIMVTNLMFDSFFQGRDITHYTVEQLSDQQIEKAEDNIRQGVSDILTLSRTATAPIIVVTNEVGMGIVPDTHISRCFRDFAGRANQKLARNADEVYLVVSGIPIKIKG